MHLLVGKHPKPFGHFRWKWLCHVATNNSNATALSTLNPFRYRGYVFDEETGLYYLRSRYYNPTCCRFINMDSILLKGLLVSNLQAYCCNNPVLHSDSNGRNIFEDLWHLLHDTVNASQEVEQYNIQTKHEAWQQAGALVVDTVVDTINATQEMERYNMNLELFATKRYMYAFDFVYDSVDKISFLLGMEEKVRHAFPSLPKGSSVPKEPVKAGSLASKAILGFWVLGTINDYLVEKIKDAEWGELQE